MNEKDRRSVVVVKRPCKSVKSFEWMNIGKSSSQRIISISLSLLLSLFLILEEKKNIERERDRVHDGWCVADSLDEKREYLGEWMTSLSEDVCHMIAADRPTDRRRAKERNDESVFIIVVVYPFRTGSLLPTTLKHFVYIYAEEEMCTFFDSRIENER